MKRRTFILTAIAGAAIITIPVIKYRCRDSITGDPLLRPDVLSRFCDKDTILEIGRQYMVQVPAEARKEKLIELLLTSDKGEKLKSSDESEISKWIEQKVQQDFQTERMVIVNGWILSATETRQCALLSLS
ncbi:MAG: hypothetical protein Q8941_00365 [Bacteroidota bacterium]|nr:hypothetical protein [Bacteroidota bacterium]